MTPKHEWNPVDLLIAGVCDTGKKRFGTVLNASRALVEAAKHRDNPRRKEMRIYRCPRCGGYHLTSQEKRG